MMLITELSNILNFNKFISLRIKLNEKYWSKNLLKQFDNVFWKKVVYSDTYLIITNNPFDKSCLFYIFQHLIKC